MADREHGDVVAFGEGGQRLEDPAHIHHSVRVDAAHVAGDRINDDESYVADFANRFLKSRKVGAKIEGPARTIFVGDCTQRMDTGHICTRRVEARPNGVGVTILSGKDDDVTARRAASVGPSGADRDDRQRGLAARAGARSCVNALIGICPAELTVAEGVHEPSRWFRRSGKSATAGTSFFHRPVLCGFCWLRHVKVNLTQLG